VPVLNKIDAFLFSPAILNVIGQAKSTLHFERAMAKRRVVIANLARGIIGARRRPTSWARFSLPASRPRAWRALPCPNAKSLEAFFAPKHIPVSGSPAQVMPQSLFLALADWKPAPHIIVLVVFLTLLSSRVSVSLFIRIRGSLRAVPFFGFG
jgi:hypothetical protein